MLERLTPTRDLRALPEPELLALWREDKRERAREVLVNRYQQLVRSMAGKFKPPPHDFADYVQIGNIGLLAAIDKCESSRKLSSYARTAIYRAIRDYKNETEGPVYRPVGSQDSFKYRWASPGARAMLLASEGDCFDDELSPSFRSKPDWSFDFEYETDGETFSLYDGFEFHEETFDRRGHEERIKLDQALQTLDLRSRHIIEKRWLINECFDHIDRYIEPEAEQASPIEQEDLAAFFGISRQRIGQIEDAAIARLKSAAPLLSVGPSFAAVPHVAPPRWNALLINWFLLCGKDEYPTYPVFLKRAPRPNAYLDSSDALLERLGELLAVCLRCLKPSCHQGWRWFKPTIVDEGWRSNSHTYVASACTFPRRNPRPYSRTELSRAAHVRIAYLRLWRNGDSLGLRNAGDAAKVWRIVSGERGRKPTAKANRRWRYIDPSGNVIPSDYYWPQPWRFAGWYPRPRKRPQSNLAFRLTGRKWVALNDPNAPASPGDDGSLMTDAVGQTVEFAKGKGERAIRISLDDAKILS